MKKSDSKQIPEQARYSEHDKGLFDALTYSLLENSSRAFPQRRTWRDQQENPNYSESDFHLFNKLMDTEQPFFGPDRQENSALDSAPDYQKIRFFD